ncbi:MAG: adenosylcobinamide-GDP ribazoletransferase [Candidatus Omnitrophica bacterium]|nr:adenosylcobinamide-GDP ribazoletransferase [Candidatus Omnitrophota bacterium]MDD5500925.1 adenosylcobinamide-GDP ribazoletransferase [Candidatus Omnitrophota bacterium]
MIILKRILAAVTFLTVFPFSGKGEADPRELGKAMGFFPLAGLFIGLILACAYALSSLFFSPLFVSVLVIVLWAFLSGLLHLEGFVDAADGFSAGCGREKTLEIMKDHHCGAKGVILLVLLIVSKIAVFNETPDSLRIAALLLAPVAGRWAMVCAACLCPYARKTGGFGRVFVENCGKREFFLSSFIFVFTASFLLRLGVFIWIVPFLFFVFISLFWLNRRIGGVTGDILGALNEVSELVCLSFFLFMR